MLPRLLLIALVSCVALPAKAWQEQFGPLGSAYRGRIDFVFVGASLADNQGLVNGVNCLKPSATATVRQSALPQNPHLVSATLYVGGSLIDEVDSSNNPISDYPSNTPSVFQQGATYPPDGVIFHSHYLASQYPDYVAADALAATPRSVRFKPPGASAAITVTNNGVRGPYISVLYKNSGPEMGNLAFFLTPIDVTNVILDNGGPLVGDYEVSGLLADVCHGQDVVCTGVTGAPTCSTVSAIDSNGAASFALFLVVEDVSLPQRSITVFEGLTDIRNFPNGLLHESLTLDSPISSPASGALAFYGLEGDLMVPLVPTIDGPTCAGSTTIYDEYIQVNGHGDANPQAGGMCLVDADNPVNNIFNGTINQEPRAPNEPVCAAGTPENLCCNGPGLCGVVGVDIDRFNISDALTPGVTKVDTWLHSSLDEFYLASLVLGIDVFDPTLQADTQIRVISADANHNVRIGTPAVYSIAISNTGNVAATGIHVTMDAPAGVTGFTVQALPAGASDLSSATGGTAGTGHIDVSGFNVAPGDVAEIRFAVTTTCDAGIYLVASGRVASYELPPFNVSAPIVAVRGPGLDGTSCQGVDIDGPFAIREDANRVLRGGGGCNALASPAANGLSFVALVALLAAVLAAIRRRRHLGLLAMLLIVAASSAACGHRHSAQSTTPPDTTIDPGDPLPGSACSIPLMVGVTRADGSHFCIDRFEATLDSGSLGQTHQGSGDDTVMTTDNSTLAVAIVAIGVAPSHNVSWYQAKAACANAHKYLCSANDWELACRGEAGYVYPYGDSNNETACNGFFAYAANKPAVTGSYAACVSSFGAYDMSGNLEEWTATAVARLPSSSILDDRAVRGGGYNANANALACAGPEYHAAPGSTAPDRGFRCCADVP